MLALRTIIVVLTKDYLLFCSMLSSDMAVAIILLRIKEARVYHRLGCAIHRMHTSQNSTLVKLVIHLATSSSCSLMNINVKDTHGNGVWMG